MFKKRQFWVVISVVNKTHFSRGSLGWLLGLLQRGSFKLFLV